MVAFYLSYRRRYLGLFVLVGAEFLLFPRPQFLGAYIRPVDVVFIAFLIATIVFAWRKEGIPRTGFELPLVCVGIATLLSSLFALHHLIAFKKLVQQIELILIVYLTATAFREGEGRGIARKVWLLILGLMSFEALYGAYQYVTNAGNIYMPGGLVRASGTLGNDLASYLLLGVAVGLGLFLSPQLFGTSRLSPFLTMLSTGLIGAVLLLTQVRGAWVGLILLLSAAFGIYRRNWKHVLLVALTMSTIVVVLLWAGQAAFLQNKNNLSETRQQGGLTTPDVRQAASPQNNNNFSETLQQRGLATLHVRFLLWQSAFNMWLHHPLAGVGPGNYGLLFTEPVFAGAEMRSVARLFRLSPEINAHNTFFTTLAEKGIWGVISTIWLLIAAFGAAARLHRHGKKLSPCVQVIVGTGILLYAISLPLFFFSGPPGGRLWWVVLGMIGHLEEQKGSLHG